MCSTAASPAEALQAADLPQGRLDLDAFLRHVAAANAPFADIADVAYEAVTGPVIVRADEFALEDVVTHPARNADRYRRRAPRSGSHSLHPHRPPAPRCTTRAPPLPTTCWSEFSGRASSSDPDPACCGRWGTPRPGPVRGPNLYGQDGRAIARTTRPMGVAFTLTFQRLG